MCCPHSPAKYLYDDNSFFSDRNIALSQTTSRGKSMNEFVKFHLNYFNTIIVNHKTILINVIAFPCLLYKVEGTSIIVI